MKIGIVYIATGDYSKFWPDFYSTCEEYFCVDAQKCYELFTDRIEALAPVPANVHIHEIEDKGWIVTTSYKSKYICSIENELSEYDYLFYLNSNFLFVSPIMANEVVSDSEHDYLTALSFDHYLQLNADEYPYDRNPSSHACISFGEGVRYFQGGFYGGRTKEMLLLSQWCQCAIDEDFQQHIIARFHDESYLNRYLLTKRPKVLNDEYAFQNIWPYYGNFKAVVRDKQSVLGAECLSALRNNYTDSSLSFLLNDEMRLVPWQIVNLYGGLGNQMFGYALYKYLEKKFGLNFKYWISPFSCQNSHNGYELSNIFHRVETSSLLPKDMLERISDLDKNNVEYISEKYASIIQAIVLPTKPVSIFSGCWQCVSYVQACAHELRQIFTFDERLLNEASLSVLPVLKQNNSVSIHIRRGDYLEDNNEWKYSGICTLDYYKRAMDHMKTLLPKQPYFVIFTDDRQWVRQNFNVKNVLFVDWNTGKDSWQDMFLMSVCHHHIIANSTFSWWGAWLGEHTDTKTIAPAIWYNTMDAPDLLPATWITVPISPDNGLLRRLCNQLLLKSSYMEDLGLHKGKMGSVLFFFHYSRYTDNPIYENYAEELFDEVYDEVNKGLSYSFANGLCGIGWAVEYLVKNKFIEGDTDEALADVDRQVMLYDPLRIADYSFSSGLDGVACYVLCRLLSHRDATSCAPFDSRYLDGLYRACESKKGDYMQAYVAYREKQPVEYSLEEVLEKVFMLSRNAFGTDYVSWHTGLRMMTGF